MRDRLEKFLAYYSRGMGRSERRPALGTFLRGPLLDGERKYMMPMARRLPSAQRKVVATHQRIHEEVTVANWDEAEVYPGIDAFVLGDAGFAMMGKQSAGYTGITRAHWGGSLTIRLRPTGILLSVIMPDMVTARPSDKHLKIAV